MGVQCDPVIAVTDFYGIAVAAFAPAEHNRAACGGNHVRTARGGNINTGMDSGRAASDAPAHAVTGKNGAVSGLYQAEDVVVLFRFLGDVLHVQVDVLLHSDTAGEKK
jgi:hypothetical protein